MAFFLFVANSSIAARSPSRKIPSLSFSGMSLIRVIRDRMALSGLRPGGLVLQAVVEGADLEGSKNPLDLRPAL